MRTVNIILSALRTGLHL